MLRQPSSLSLPRSQADSPLPSLTIKAELFLLTPDDLNRFLQLKAHNLEAPAKTDYPQGSCLPFTGIISDLTFHSTPTSGPRFKVGEKIMSVSYMPCGKCEKCNSGKATVCSSPFTIQLTPHRSKITLTYDLPPSLIQRKPDALPDALAALLEPIAEAVQGINKVSSWCSGPVVIMGEHPQLLIYLHLLSKHPASPILIALSQSKAFLDKATQLGAHHTFCIPDFSPSDAVKSITDGYGAYLVICYLSNLTDNRIYSNHILDIADTGSAILLTGYSPKEQLISLDTKRFHYDQITLKGTKFYTPADVKQASQYLLDKRYRWEILITKQHHLSELSSLSDSLRQNAAIYYPVAVEM